MRAHEVIVWRGDPGGLFLKLPPEQPVSDGTASARTAKWRGSFAMSREMITE